MRQIISEFVRRGLVTHTPPIRKQMRSLFLILTLLLGVGNVWATSVTWQGTTALPGTATSIAGDDNVTIMTSSTNTYSNPIRVYANTTITIEVASGYTIESVTYEASSTGSYVTNAQNATVTPSSVTPSVSDKNVTWSFTDETSTFTFTPSAQTRSSGITVVYSSTGGGSEPSFSVYPKVIDFGTVDQGASVASKTVAVNFANLTGSVTYSELTSPFSASGAILATGDEITITPSTATIGEYEQTLTIQSTADSKSQDVTVTMNVVAPFDGLALTFPDYNDKGVSSYTSSWTATKSGQVWTIDNFNNNSNGWSLIKAGRNGNASVASITTLVEDHAVSDVTVTIDGVTASKINSHKLYVADNSSFTGAIEVTGAPSTIAAGNIVYTVPVVNRANDLYYKLEFNCASGSSNGFLQISKITYAYAAASPQKDPAGLAYDAADAQKLVKVGADFTAPTLTNPNSLTVTYTSSNTEVAEVATDGAVTIKAAGKAEITASSAETETYKAGSAKYTIFVATEAGTAEDPLTEASAKALIDLGCTLNAHVAGTIKTPTYYSTSQTYTVTLTADFQFYKLKDLGNQLFTSAYLKANDQLVVLGPLGKHNTTYQLGDGCYIVNYEEFTEPLTDISNTKETAYTVAQALALAADPTSDLSKAVYIAGVVYQVNSFNSTNGTYNIYIKDAGTSEDDGKFEFYKCSGLYEVGGTPAQFAEGDVQIGDEVIGYGVMTYFSGGSIWEFGQPNQLVSLNRPEVAVTGVSLTESTAEVEIGKTVTLHATVNPDNASDKGITWSVQSGNDYASVDENGVVTGIAAGEAVIRATSVADGTKYAECTVTVNAPAPDDRYKAEQTGFDAISGKLATVTEGTHKDKEYISYEAKQGAAATPPSIQNTDKIRLYQNGGLLVIGAAKGCKIDQVFLTTGSTYASTTIGYSKTETAIAQTGDEVAASTEWHTATGQNADTIVIVCLGTNKNSRIDVAKLDVRYTGDPAAIHHYLLAGNYANEFNQADVFNHDGLIVYAAYDEQGEDLVDITADCSFSAPDMNQAGEQTVEITYNNAVVESYTITINATETATLKFYAPVAWENVYAFTWEGTNTGNHEMTAVEEGSRWFECDMEKGVPFLVYNGSWDGMNQTENIAALDGPKCYAWATLSGDGKYNTIETCEMSYYIAGENLPEVTWNEGEHKAMTNNEVVFENLAAGTYKFKVTNNTWAWNLGYANADQTNSNITLVDDDGNVQFATNVAMNVTIAYNPATEKITVNGIVPPKPFVPNIQFGSAEGSTMINDLLIEGVDSYSNAWTITTVPNAGGKSFTQSGEYSQVGSGSKPAESITFSATLANSNEIAAISYIAIKLGGFNGTVGNVSVKVDGTESASGVLNGTNDVVVESTNSIMGREISIEISDIDKGVKCYGIEYAYQKYEFVALKFFAPRDETNKWDHVYAYAYDPNNNYQAYVAWPGEEVTAKDAEWYVYNAPKGHNVIFHDNAGMQTNDIVDVQEEACYVSTAIDYTSMKVTLEKKCIVDYYVAGDAAIMGEWNAAYAACKFDENNQVVFHDVPAGSYQFKITNGTWAWALGGNEFLKNEEGCGSIAYTGDLGNTCFKIDEVQDVTITYYPATREICLGAVTVKTPGELTANDIELFIDEWETPNYWTNITDYTAADVELTFVSGDDCIEIANGQMRGKAEGSAVVKIAIAETALFTGVENTFTVTVSAVPPTPDYGSYQRDVTNGNYGTICLPYASAAIEGAEIYSIVAKNDLGIMIESVNSMDAGVPYIFLATAEQLTVTYAAGGPVTAQDALGLVGNIEEERVDVPMGSYILYNNLLRKVTDLGHGHIGKNRAYIDLTDVPQQGSEPEPAPGVRRRSIAIQPNGVATDLDNLNGEANGTTKLVRNGQLIIIRDGVRYNAQGQRLQ